MVERMAKNSELDIVSMNRFSGEFDPDDTDLVVTGV
jgi:hypothetical protein